MRQGQLLLRIVAGGMYIIYQCVNAALGALDECTSFCFLCNLEGGSCRIKKLLSCERLGKLQHALKLM